MYRKILVGIDPTHEEEGPRALKEALRVLDTDGQVIMFTVVSPPEQPFYPVIREIDLDGAKADAERALEVMIRKEAPRGIDVVSIVAVGKAARSLLQTAEGSGADLIVLTEHGHLWPLRRDTVQYVCQHAACPVLVLPTPADED